MPYDDSRPSASVSQPCDAAAHVGTGQLRIGDPARRALARLLREIDADIAAERAAGAPAAPAPAAALPVPDADDDGLAPLRAGLDARLREQEAEEQRRRDAEAAKPPPDAWGVTILQSCTGSMLCKIVAKDRKSTRPGKSTWFNAAEVPVARLAGLFGLLTGTGLQFQDRCVIRGAPIAGKVVKHVRRTSRFQADGSAPTFRDVPRAWLYLDVDSIALPAGVSIHDLKALGGIARAALPEAFRDVSCIVQASGSLGIKPGVRVHLWFALSRPITCAEAKVWTAEAPIDHAVFRSEIPIFVAPPYFEDGGVAVVKQRYAALSGSRKTVQVPDEIVVPVDAYVDSAPFDYDGPTTAAGEDVKFVLRFIPNVQRHADDGQNWEDWNYVMMALWACGQGSEEMMGLAEAWSATLPGKHNPQEFANRWRAIGNSPPARLGFRSLQGRARELMPEEYAAAMMAVSLARAEEEFEFEGGPPDDPPPGASAPAVIEPAKADAAGKIAASEPSTGRVLQGEIIDPDDLTEDGISRRFVWKYRNMLRYNPQAGVWLEWKKTHWCEDQAGAVMERSKELCRALNADYTDKLGRLTTIQHVVTLARTDPRFAATADIWDRHPMLLATPGGTVNLVTGELREARPDEYLSKLAPVTPAPAGTPHPVWDAFLAEATGGDAALIRYLHVVAGYCLTGNTREHALFFVHGKGGNGKGVFLTVLQDILGEHAQQAEKDTFNEIRGNRHTADLAAMVGKRLVAVDETEKGEAWKESLIKAVTGGGKIRAHFMGKNYFEFTPIFKLLIVGNHKPVLKTVDAAIRRRLHLIPFTRKPRKVDLFLLDKLRPEYPAIMRSFIDGCLAWQREGLIKPPAVEEATKAYLDEQDGFARWFETCCDIDDPAAFTATDEILASVNGFGMGQMSDEELADELKARGFLPGRKFHAGKQRRGYPGIRVVDGTFKL